MAEIKPSLNELLIAAQRRMAAQAEQIVKPVVDAYLREDEEVIAALLAKWDDSGTVSGTPAQPIPEGKRRTRGTSSATDDKAREAERLYNSGLTQAQIAERMTVTVKTVQRWLKRADKLRRGKKGTHNG